MCVSAQRRIFMGEKLGDDIQSVTYALTKRMQS